ncbi:MAG: GNAT family N-acetyltransferase [Acidobacteriota bacterium]
MAARHEPILHTIRLTLRPLVAADAPMVHEAMSDPRVMAYWSSAPHTTREETAAWMADALDQAGAGRRYEWAIEHRGAVIGRVAFRELPWIGCFLLPDAWGQGFASEALEAACRFGLDTLGLPAVLADVDPRNDASLALFARVGFTERARGTGTWEVGGRWQDSVFLARDHPAHGAGTRIEEADGPCDLALVRALMREYQAWLGIDLGFQNFDDEVGGLPGAYAAPGGAILLAFDGGTPLGMVAMRPLTADRVEMKRLFVRQTARARGVGRLLVAAIIERARATGYHAMCLDTLPVMARAQRMYERFGFADVEPYYESPVPGTRFLSLSLRP